MILTSYTFQPKPFLQKVACFRNEEKCIWYEKFDLKIRGKMKDSTVPERHEDWSMFYTLLHDP